MTISKAIELCDAQKPNGYSDADKIHWLDKLDRQIFREVISTHEAEGAPESFEGYDEDTDPTTEMLADEAYSDLYVKWLFAQIDFANAETQRYENSRQMFNALYDAYTTWYNRTYIPVQPNFVKGVRADRGWKHVFTPLD